ncbi:MAG TPA: hypothetical protein VE987_11735 [Polyangiaceae bacterium]|nr:hypothetical protein [Polyangiaceae bacterium]
MARSSAVQRFAIAGALVAAFAAGAAWHAVWPRAARAQATASPSSVYVPAEGLVFRTADGRPLARLWRGPKGGVFDLYDDNGAAATRLSAGVIGAARQEREPYVLDDEDPFTNASPAEQRPGPGF